MAETDALLQTLQRDINCLGDDNKATRKRALTKIAAAIVQAKPALAPHALHAAVMAVLKPVLKCFPDPMDSCREAAADFVARYVAMADPADLPAALPYVFPVLVARVGGRDVAEPAEEIRLQLVALTTAVVDRCPPASMALYIDDLSAILQRVAADPFHGVVVAACALYSSVARAIPERFRMVAKLLAKPAAAATAHAMAKVRRAAVLALGPCVEFGDADTLKDLLPALAARTHDDNATVRRAVLEVAGGWGLTLPDRYSHWSRLLPLLLAGLDDEVAEVRTAARAAWDAVGAQYETENEKDLKARLDFEPLTPDGTRARLGCRVLVEQSLMALVPALLGDLGDWTAATRLRAARLLRTLLVQAEDKSTMHLQKLLQGLIRAAGDEETAVADLVVASAELLGRYADAGAWTALMLSELNLATNRANGFVVLGALVRGSPAGSLAVHYPALLAALATTDVAASVNKAQQDELLLLLRDLFAADPAVFAAQFDLRQLAFNTVIYLLSAGSDVAQCDAALVRLAEVSNTDTHGIYSQHTKSLLESTLSDPAAWTAATPARLVFETLAARAGAALAPLLDRVLGALGAALAADGDVAVRLSLLTLLARLFAASGATLNADNLFTPHAASVVTTMIIPNLVWRAGRSHAALRTAALAALWAQLSAGLLPVDALAAVRGPLQVQLMACLEDDTEASRALTCRVLALTLPLLMPVYTADYAGYDELHKMYPELIKRLDDRSDAIRLLVLDLFPLYLQGMTKPGYDAKALYQAHVTAVMSGLLLHLDDPNSAIQEKTAIALESLAAIHPLLLTEKIEAVKDKFRNPSLCARLLAACSLDS